MSEGGAGRSLLARAGARFRWMLEAALHTAADTSAPREFGRLDPKLIEASRGALERWETGGPEWAGRFVAWAGAALGPDSSDAAVVASTRSVNCYGLTYRLEGEGAWHRDPTGERAWPLRPHAWIRLDDPRRAGDARMQWEPARLAHEVRLASAARDGATDATRGWRELARSFDAANPIGRGIHWAVGMEIAIGAAARIFALETVRGGDIEADFASERLERLALTANYLARHVERHPSGRTSNHTLAVLAGLALLSGVFRGCRAADEWRSRAQLGLLECLEQQVLAGAHAEASLAYARFSAEAAFVAAAALDLPRDAEPVRRLLRMVELLERGALPSGLPHVGDCDESFFPPFGLTRWETRDPFDAKPLIDSIRAWWSLPTPPVAPHPVAATLAGAGLVRFGDARFDGILVTRSHGEGWMPTHGHNDLLSVALDLDGESLLIDPGTGGYAFDRALRHELRSIRAHSTVQIGELEPWPLRPGVLFEGPGEIAGGCEASEANTLRVTAWREGGEGVRVTRRLRLRGGVLWIADLVTAREAPSRAPHDVASTTRFVLASNLSATLVRPDCAHISRLDAPSHPHAEFLLLHPEESGWQIRRAPRSRRYAQKEEGIVLEAQTRGRLPHRWLVAIRPLRDRVSV